MSGSEFDGNHLSEYKGVKLKPVWTLDKKGFAAMTSSLSAAIKAAFTWSVTDSDEDALNPLEWLLNKILEFFKKLMDFFG